MWIAKYCEYDLHSAPTTANFVREGPIGSDVIFQSISLKYKKSASITLIGSQDIARSLKIVFWFIFVSLCAIGLKFWQHRFQIYIFQSKKLHSIIVSSLVIVQTSFADGRTESQFPAAFMDKGGKKIKKWDFSQILTYFMVFPQFLCAFLQRIIPLHISKIYQLIFFLNRSFPMSCISPNFVLKTRYND